MQMYNIFDNIEIDIINLYTLLENSTSESEKEYLKHEIQRKQEEYKRLENEFIKNLKES